MLRLHISIPVGAIYIASYIAGLILFFQCHYYGVIKLVNF